MLNRKASTPKSKPDEIMNSLALQPGQNIADIGTGGGYFSLRFAEAVENQGIVYAVDTDKAFLDMLTDNARKKGANNIKTVLAASIKSSIPQQSLDYVFLRNAYHHLQNRIQYFKELSTLLKPTGKIAIIEYTKNGKRRPKGHYVPKEKIIEEMNEAGYKEEKSYDYLPEQSFTIYAKKKSDTPA